MGSVLRRKRRLILSERYKETCHWCGGPTPLAVGTMDHLVCRSKGGANALFNLVWSCRPCNEARGSTPEGEWRRLHGGRTGRPEGRPDEDADSSERQASVG